jgi:hypothetical protein
MIRIFYNRSFIDEILKFKKKATVKKMKNEKCIMCNKCIENNMYKLKDIIFYEMDIHNLQDHYYMKCELYENLNIYNKRMKININDINIMDGLYEVGSKKIYIEKKQNDSYEVLKYSEHYGYLELILNNVNKICVLNKKRDDENFKDIYMPELDIELFNYEYIFHTHPKFYKLGCRRLIIFEYPSINDLLHFIDHYNLGKVKGSIVISPEGLYMIKKLNSSNNEKLIIDTNIFIKKIDEIFNECEELLINKYYLNSITYEYFYEKVINDLECIVKINNVLRLFDITIDYYARSSLFNNYVILSIFV